MSAGAGAPDYEAMFVEYVRRLGKEVQGRRLILLHVSRLQASNRREHHLRVIQNAFEPLMRRTEGQLFQFRNDDMAVSFKGATAAEIDDVVLKVRYLFANDPLVAPDSDQSGAFATWYDLEFGDYSALLTEAERRGAEAEQTRRNRTANAGPPDAPLDPARLSRIEAALGSVDVTPMLRRQLVCTLVEGAPPVPVMNEVYVAIPMLRKALLPGVDLGANRWLFQYMTEALDRRVLAAIPQAEAASELATSINVNLTTLLSPQFLAFDRTLRAKTQKTIVLELQPIDVFGDMGGFIFARDVLRDRGYRFCLDGLSHLTFPLIDRERLKLDFQKIQWHPDMLADEGRERGHELAAAINAAGVQRVILCRCDDDRAIAFGRRLGIRLFQGRHVDALIQQRRAAAQAQ
jgi:hypothetical protein